MWQNKATEKKYCMEAKNKANVEIEDCSFSNRQKWMVQRGIIESAEERGRCLTWARRGTGVNLMFCQEGNPYQVWDGFDIGATRGFELHPHGEQERSATNPHHPRRGESVIVQPTKKARKHTTSKWEVY